MRSRLALLAVPLLAACSHAGSDNAFQWSTELPQGAVVHIRDGSGNITVSRAAGQAAVVTGSRRWRKSRPSDIRFVVEQRANEYYVCAMWRNSGKCADGTYRGRNTSTFLSMFSLFHRNSDASADFTVLLPANASVDARTNTGSVQVEGVSGGVTARAVNGTVRASNVSGPLTLATTNGDVRLSVDSLSPADSVRLTTTNGSVHAELPPGTEGNYDLSVVNGLVQSDIPLSPTPNSHVGRHLAGQIGAASRSVRMRTINGRVVVTTSGSPASIR